MGSSLGCGTFFVRTEVFHGNIVVSLSCTSYLCGSFIVLCVGCERLIFSVTYYWFISFFQYKLCVKLQWRLLKMPGQTETVRPRKLQSTGNQKQKTGNIIYNTIKDPHRYDVEGSPQTAHSPNSGSRMTQRCSSKLLSRDNKN